MLYLHHIEGIRQATNLDTVDVVLREFKLFNKEIFGGLSQNVWRNSFLDNACLSAGS